MAVLAYLWIYKVGGGSQFATGDSAIYREWLELGCVVIVMDKRLAFDQKFRFRCNRYDFQLVKYKIKIGMLVK